MVRVRGALRQAWPRTLLLWLHSCMLCTSTVQTPQSWPSRCHQSWASRSDSPGPGGRKQMDRGNWASSDRFWTSSSYLGPMLGLCRSQTVALQSSSESLSLNSSAGVAAVARCSMVVLSVGTRHPYWVIGGGRVWGVVAELRARLDFAVFWWLLLCRRQQSQEFSAVCGAWGSNDCLATAVLPRVLHLLPCLDGFCAEWVCPDFECKHGVACWVVGRAASRELLAAHFAPRDIMA